MNITTHTLQTMKQREEAIVMLTAYDAQLARIAIEAGVDLLLVGDSLGNVIQGEATTLPVSMKAMIYHTQCVVRGANGAFIVADMPFMSYATTEQALKNAAKLMQAGARMVKMEGGAWLLPTVSALVERGIPVCAHLGLTPQSVHKLGGFKIQGKDDLSAQTLVEDALALEKAGAQLLVLECIPSALARRISQQLSIPVIGIGAGVGTDGQVMVMHDILGISDKAPSFAKDFLQQGGSIAAAFSHYVHAVKDRTFPTE